MLTQNEFIQTFKRLGVQEGDLLLVHSDLMLLGLPEKARSRQDILEFYLESFQRIIGENGTLSVPAFFYEYARNGEPFDTRHSPVSKSLGAFSAYIGTLPQTIRSGNPLQSIASIGKLAHHISGGNSLCGYGVNSPWDRIRKNNGKIVFVGIGLEVMTYVHHIEQAVGVPHMYWKLYTYPVMRNGEVIPGHPVSAVRYLNYEIEYNLKPFENHLLHKGIAKSLPLGKGKIIVVDAEEAYQEGIRLLEKDIYVFLKHPPKFIPGQIPYDGIPGR